MLRWGVKSWHGHVVQARRKTRRIFVPSLAAAAPATSLVSPNRGRLYMATLASYGSRWHMARIDRIPRRAFVGTSPLRQSLYVAHRARHFARLRV